jgi:hypothetical protein
MVAVFLPLFYFHIIGQSILLDETGIGFEDARSALQYATSLAQDLRLNGDFRDGTIVIENDDDGDLFEVPLAGLSS